MPRGGSTLQSFRVRDWPGELLAMRLVARAGLARRRPLFAPAVGPAQSGVGRGSADGSLVLFPAGKHQWGSKPPRALHQEQVAATSFSSSSDSDTKEA